MRSIALVIAMLLFGVASVAPAGAQVNSCPQGRCR